MLTSEQQRAEKKILPTRLFLARLERAHGCRRVFDDVLNASAFSLIKEACVIPRSTDTKPDHSPKGRKLPQDCGSLTLPLPALQERVLGCATQKSSTQGLTMGQQVHRLRLCVRLTRISVET